MWNYTGRGVLHATAGIVLGRYRADPQPSRHMPVSPHCVALQVPTLLCDLGFESSELKYSRTDSILSRALYICVLSSSNQPIFREINWEWFLFLPTGIRSRTMRNSYCIAVQTHCTLKMVTATDSLGVYRWAVWNLDCDYYYLHNIPCLYREYVLVEHLDSELYNDKFHSLTVVSTAIKSSTLRWEWHVAHMENDAHKMLIIK
jgi:hypothetical protein